MKRVLLKRALIGTNTLLRIMQHPFQDLHFTTYVANMFHFPHLSDMNTVFSRTEAAALIYFFSNSVASV